MYNVILLTLLFTYDFIQLQRSEVESHFLKWEISVRSISHEFLLHFMMIY